ncbi:hypothetical protein OBBRIDRAFT_720454, partial [Obba rivulosa]
LVPAHWGLGVPIAADPDIGKVIHVTGDALSGFTLEFKRNYRLSSTARAQSIHLIATVDDSIVVDVPGDGSFSIDQDAADQLERKASSIPAPGKSLTLGHLLYGTRRVIKNCRMWLRDVVGALVIDKLFPESAIAAMDAAPKN